MRVRERNAYMSYLRSGLYSLYDCYNNFSSRKAQAWEYCQNLMEEKNGSGLKVISYNTNFFTAGFVYEDEGKKMFMYITASSDVASEIEED